MNCREFEERWNDVLDARSAGMPDLDLRLAAHASNCRHCQAVSARHQLLRQAISAWAQSPSLEAASIERIRPLSFPSTPKVQAKSRPVAGRWVRFVIPMATAAALFAMAWLGGPWRVDQPRWQELEAPTAATPHSPGPIEAALEKATSATIDLALEASAPAARIGRDVLEFEKGDAPSSATGAEAVSTVESATVAIQAVGERVNAGVKPISGSARHAFSFLLGPPPDPEKVPNESGEISR